MSEKPPLRIVHHLHRTGGTLISKCLASLPNISLLSEVNPEAPKNVMILDPVFQANFWLRLLGEQEAERLKDATFEDKIVAVHAAAVARGDSLIIRNWAYVDFFAHPNARQPANRLSTTLALENHFKLHQVVTVRHPVDQWLSWCAYRGSAKASNFTFAQFAAACVRFRDATSGLPVVRYEDFVERPGPVMRHLCDLLALKFDPVFLKRWRHYHQITGDDNEGGAGGWKIARRPRREISQEQLDEIKTNTDIQSLLQFYGYDD